MGLQKIFVSNIMRGYFIYCDFNNFTFSSFWQEHILPPGAYIHFIIVYLFVNIPLLIYELINMILVYKIILKYYGDKSALIGMLFVAFIPISILNGMIELDPMSVCLTFMLLGIYFFIYNKPILSSISIAIGTLILYIPAIMLIPIIMYYIKNDKKKFFNISKYLIVFLLSIVIACLPFLLMCPERFIFYINYSVNNPHTSNFLYNEEFFLTQFLYAKILSILGFDLKAINLLQLGVFLIVILILYKKLSFKDKKDIIISSIILITVISMLTFYLHYRITYWIFILSIILLSFNSEKFVRNFKDYKVILIGIYYCIVSFSLIFISNEFVEPNNYGMFSLTFILFFTLIFILYVIGFLVTGFLILKTDFAKKTVIYTSIMLLYYIFYQILVELVPYSEFSLLFDILMILFILIEFLTLTLFITNILYPNYKQSKISSLLK